MSAILLFPCRDRIEVVTAFDEVGRRIYLLEMVGVDERGRRFRTVIESAYEISEMAELALYWEVWGTPVDYRGVCA